MENQGCETWEMFSRHQESGKHIDANQRQCSKNYSQKGEHKGST